MTDVLVYIVRLYHGMGEKAEQPSLPFIWNTLLKMTPKLVPDSALELRPPYWPWNIYIDVEKVEAGITARVQKFISMWKSLLLDVPSLTLMGIPFYFYERLPIYYAWTIWQLWWPIHIGNSTKFTTLDDKEGWFSCTLLTPVKFHFVYMLSRIYLQHVFRTLFTMFFVPSICKWEKMYQSLWK